jgi:hypothetical protein
MGMQKEEGVGREGNPLGWGWVIDQFVIDDNYAVLDVNFLVSDCQNRC